MCGITAIISSEPDDHRLLKSMTEIIKHRGPDNFGYYQKRDISLGYSRLAILDLTEAGNQPMHNEDGSVCLICNGEIYNYMETSKELKAKGHIFKSKSDCETLLHLYEEYGEDFLEHVNGMFAFVLWDERKRRLLAAVDRFGKKPLYYALKPGRLAIASEMKSLLVLPWVERELDPLATDRYLALRYVPAPLTILKSVRKLEPSTILTYQSEHLMTARYWRPQRSDLIVYDSNAVDRFQELFTDAVRKRMQSDVPLGLYLSGGVDSSAVAGVMRPFSTEKLISYTLTIDYKYDEREKAKNIADHLNVEFNPVNVGQEDFDLLPKIMYHLDEPFGDLLCIPSYILARKAKEKLTVILTGDGADEILNGYFHQKIMRSWNHWKPFISMRGMNRVLSSTAKLMPASVLNVFFDYPDRLGKRERIKLAQTLSKCRSFGAFYEGITSCISQEDKLRLYLPSLTAQLSGRSLNEEFDQTIEAFQEYPFLSRLSLLDLKYWIPFSVLFRLDKLNMAHAVEVRSPFLDYRIVEMALNLSDEGKLNKNRNKEILRALIERLYPPPLREKGKQAFYMPLPYQFRQKFFSWINDLLNKGSIERRGLFQWIYVKELLDSFKIQESMLVNRQLMTLAMLELWFRVFMDGKEFTRK
jgi:asparagine synthase (glutamine-hydrolysing)